MTIDAARRTYATFFLPAACAAWLALPGMAAGGEVKAVVELFTSQGCSSCPPADRLLGDLAKDSSIVAMTLPVDYWDYLGWRDTLANPRYSARQRAYARKRGDRNVATPQVVVNGQVPVLGSDRTAIESAIAHTQTGAMTASVSVVAAGDKLHVDVAARNGVGDAASDGNDKGDKAEARKGEAYKGEVWLCAVTKKVPVRIGKGENGGRAVVYHNVSRRWLKLGDWNGKAARWTVPLSDITALDADAAAAIVQGGSADSPGPMLGAAFASIR